MAAGINDNRKGYFVSSEDVRNRLEEMKLLDLEAKEPDYNLFVINTPNGQLKIKSKLSLEEWMAKYQSKANKKEKKYFKASDI